MQAWRARGRPVVLDKVADVLGQFVALDIEPGLDFRRDIFGDVVRPVFESIEGDDAKRIVELAGDQFADHGFPIVSLDLGLVAYEFGLHAAPGPLLDCNVAAFALSRYGGEAHRGALDGLLTGAAVLGEPLVPLDAVGLAVIAAGLLLVTREIPRSQPR